MQTYTSPGQTQDAFRAAMRAAGLGVYSETVTGLREYPVRCAGYFGLRRVNRVNVLQ
ncbi:MAG: hypothetical protein WCK27_22855 [Verrucomicrobiota bacterium]